MQKTMFMAVALAAVPVAAAHAADLYWDINGTTAGLGGGGSTWNTANAFWNTDATGGAGGTVSAWTNGTFDNAIFGGTQGTVTVSGTIDVHNITFNTSPYTLTGGTLNLGGTTPTISSTAASSSTIASVITGTAGLTKAGNAGLFLTGNNTYTGTTTISGTGSLVLGNGGTTGSLGTGAVINNGSLGFQRSDTHTVANNISGSGALTKTQGAGTTILTGTNTYSGTTTVNIGRLQVGDGGTTGTLGTGQVSAAATGGLIFNRSDTLTVTAAMSGQGGITQAGPGTTILTGNVTMTGAMFLNAGTLQVAGFANFGNPSSVTFNGGTFKNTGLFGFSRPTTLTGTGTFETVADNSVSGLISGGGSLVKTGAATLILRAANTYGGTTTISAGTLQVGAGTTVGTLGTGAVINNATLAFNRTNTLTVANTISGTGAVTQVGTGTTILSATNSYTGATTINAGTLQAGAAAGGQAFGLNSAVTLADVAGATLDLNGFNQTIGSLAGGGTTGGNVLLGAATLTTGGDNSSTAYAGVIGGGGGLIKTGSGTAALTGNNTYIGGTTISAGTLQLGDGGSTGGIAGDVTNNAALAFNRSDILTYGGVISGSGVVNQIGSGTTILTGANTYIGGTALNAGTLQVSADANLGDGAGGLTFNGGTLQNTAAFATARTLTLTGAGIVQTDADLTLSGAASGAGGLSKTGAGSLILTAENSYTGGTTISAGSLQLGNGGTSGSITGDVTNNASLIFNRSDALAIGGAISGTGSVSQIGSGITTLSGVNSYAGGTTIAAGTLSGSATSFGSGAITDNAALVIDQPTEAAFTNAIDGTGSFTKQGAGRLNYIGTGALSGTTTVAAGLLSVNGSLASSTVTVLSGASLGGTGMVGTTTVQSGGTIAPGNSIGTLQINGPYTQAAGSTYQVEVDPNTSASDRIAVTGTATLQSGAGLNATKSVPGDYRVGTVYTVLTSTGGRTGTYTLSGATTSVSAFLGLQDSYDANNAYLTVVQTGDPAAAAQTGNQQAVAAAINTLPVTDPVPTAVLNLPSDDAARSAFDQLGAQAQASAKGALVSNGLYVRDLSLDRLRDVRCGTDKNQKVRNTACDSEGPSLWAQGFGGWGGVSGNANASGLNHSSAGMLAGFDLPILDWRLGMFGGFSNSDFRLTSGPASGGSTDYHLGAYGGTNWDNISVSLGASYTWNAIRTDRAVAFGTFTDRLQASYNAGVTQIFAEAGYGMKMEGITLETFANLAYLNLRTDGFTEVGGAAALTSQADTIENVISTFGVRPSTNVDLGNFPVTLRGMAGWRHTFGTVTPTSTVAFSGGNTFTISGAPIARDAMALEAGFDFALGDSISAGLTYGGQVSSRATDQTARGTIRVSF